MARTSIQGGHKLDRFIRANQRAARQAEPEIGVGFRGHIAGLASLLEFGNPDTGLPERPAFRIGINRLREELPARLEGMARANLNKRTPVMVLTRAQATELAVWARDILRASYLSFKGPGLSERQAERKAGTAGQGKELVGSEGPKLVSHLRAYVDGQEVG